MTLFDLEHLCTPSNCLTTARQLSHDSSVPVFKATGYMWCQPSEPHDRSHGHKYTEGQTFFSSVPRSSQCLVGSPESSMCSTSQNSFAVSHSPK